MDEQLKQITKFLIQFSDETRESLANIKTQLDRIEAAQNDDVVGVLKHLDNKIVAVKEDIEEIKKGQVRQDRILEILSAKALETDSYLNDFKLK